jgi:hypothetical protein
MIDVCLLIERLGEDLCHSSGRGKFEANRWIGRGERFAEGQAGSSRNLGGWEVAEPCENSDGHADIPLVCRSERSELQSFANNSGGDDSKFDSCADMW